MGAALLSAAVLMTRRTTPRRRTIRTLVALGLLCVVAPHLRRFVLDDICLDSGGAPNRTTLRCEK
jgi:hypothetical protein